VHGAVGPALEQLARELGEIFEVALAVEPPGGLSAAWQKILDRYRVRALGEDDRYAIAGQLRLARGVPTAEVEACVRAAIQQFSTAAGAAGAPPEEIVAATGRMWAEAEPQYLGYATHRPKGMFAHALKTAHDRKGKWERPPGGYIMTCAGCGGPRLDETLACKFCEGTVRP
jgi:hypothetical protein